MSPAIKKLRIGLGSFDFIKGFCIFSVVLAHSVNRAEQTSWPFQILYAFLYLSSAAVAAFLMISGYGFKGDSPKKLLKKTFSDLMVPYFLIGAAYAVLCPFTHYPVYHSFRASFTFGMRYFLAFLLGYHTPGQTVFGFQLESNVAAYYFLALFIALNVLNLIVKLNKPALRLLCVAGCAVMCTVLEVYGIELFGIGKGLGAVPLCYFGHLLKKHRLLERLLVTPWSYLALAVIVLLLRGDVSGTTNDLVSQVTKWAAGMLTMMLGIMIGKIEWRILDPVKFLGMYSYWILAFHAVEQGSMPWQLLRVYRVYDGSLYYGIEILLKAVFILIGCVVLKQITKLKYKRRTAKKTAQRAAV